MLVANIVVVSISLFYCTTIMLTSITDFVIEMLIINQISYNYTYKNNAIKV